MENPPPIVQQIGQKRTHEVKESQIQAKLSSKNDWFVYLGQVK